MIIEFGQTKFDYWMRHREPNDFQDIKDYIRDLENGLVKEPIFRKNLNNGLVERYNPETIFWEVIENCPDPLGRDSLVA